MLTQVLDRISHRGLAVTDSFDIAQKLEAHFDIVTLLGAVEAADGAGLPRCDLAWFTANILPTLKGAREALSIFMPVVVIPDLAEARKWLEEHFYTRDYAVGKDAIFLPIN